MSEDRITFSCECGSSDFIYPNDPPKDDDLIICNGCKREVGRLDVIRAALIQAGKAELDKIAKNSFGKGFDWK